MTNALKYRKAILLIVLFTFSACLLFARGGGGGGGGSSSRGGGFLGIVGAICLVLFAIFLHLRKRAAKKVLQVAREEIWKLDYLEQTAQKAFYSFQNAWMERDLLSVSKLVTYNLYLTHNEELQGMKARSEKNVLENVSIRSIHIIACKDYLENAKDSFSAYIKGSMTDYTINEKTGKVIKGSKSAVRKFTDMYVFTRDENTWLLNRVVNEPELYEIMEAKSITEESQRAADAGLATA